MKLSATSAIVFGLVVSSCGGATSSSEPDGSGGAAGGASGGTASGGGSAGSPAAAGDAGESGMPSGGGTAGTASGGTGGACTNCGGSAGGAPDGGSPTAGSGGTGGGGAGTAGASVIADAGVPPVSCASDNDCTPFGMLCDQTGAECVHCLEDVHCGDSEACVDGDCVPFVTCVSSLDCVGAPDGKTICDTSVGRCAECASNADCSGVNNVCFQGRCECADLDSDPENCGACGNTCAGECRNGQCAATWQECLVNPPQPNMTCGDYCESIGAACRNDCDPGVQAAVADCMTATDYPVEGATCGEPVLFYVKCCCL